MLTRLVIQDVVLIDSLTVPFRSGLNVFTGETGAGKSILLDALALALGARSDVGLIRAGAAQASVVAEFVCDPSSSLTTLFEEHGLQVEDPMILRRTITKDGKSRAFFCDQPIGVTLLRHIGELLLEVHGQFETHGLLNPVTHRDLLDSFAGVLSLKDSVAQAFTTWKQVHKSLSEAQALSEQAKREEDFLYHALEEFDELDPVVGEIEKLSEQRAQLQNREKIIEALTLCVDSLSGDKGAIDALTQSGKHLARIADKAKVLPEILTIVDRATQEATEAADQLAHFMQKVDGDATSLEKIEERLFRLRALARKHNVNPEELLKACADLRARYDLVTGQSEQLGRLEKENKAARETFVKGAEKLSAKRGQAAAVLAEGIMKELPPLKLERAFFTVECNPLPESQWAGEGMDRIAFLAATNGGIAPLPLNKVASGGELARFMLAIKVMLSRATPVPTLVFDEVDAGIGGATASAVGERLALLAQDVQVLVVTHSPQIAARGVHHLRVRKQEKGKFPTTLVDVLPADERVEEIARMLAGAEVTDAARQAAQSLIGDQISSPKKKKSKANA